METRTPITILVLINEMLWDGSVCGPHLPVKMSLYVTITRSYIQEEGWCETRVGLGKAIYGYPARSWDLTSLFDFS
jgi:hypothetical protein